MKERFLLENNEAASDIEAAFILDQKSGLRARIIQFRTHRDLDQYQANGSVVVVRQLPVLLEISADQPSGKWVVSRILKRMENWYFHTQLKPPPIDTPLASGSAD